MKCLATIGSVDDTEVSDMKTGFEGCSCVCSVMFVPELKSYTHIACNCQTCSHIDCKSEVLLKHLSLVLCFARH